MTRKPELQVLGVHKLNVTPQLVDAQFGELYGDVVTEQERNLARKQCKIQLESTVLIEILVKKIDENFRLTDFTQSVPGLPKDSWQAPYMVKFLDADGSKLIPTEFDELPQRQTYRVAFYLHFFRSTSPLRTSYGERFCPAISQAPERLSQLVPYDVVD